MQIDFVDGVFLSTRSKAGGLVNNPSDVTHWASHEFCYKLFQIEHFSVGSFIQHGLKRSAHFFVCGVANFEGEIKASLAEEGRVKRFSPIGRSYDHNFVCRGTFHESKKLRDLLNFVILGDRAARGCHGIDFFQQNKGR